MLRVDFVTLFPEAVLIPLRQSVLGRAESRGLVAFRAVNPRDFAHDPHRTVDDRPYGGGPGMLLRPEPVSAALEWLGARRAGEVIVTEPWGKRFDQAVAGELAVQSHLVFVCGHYEGIDHRIEQSWATRTLSLGDFVLTGGEVAAVAMTDAIVRLIPGVLGEAGSLSIDSHSAGLLGPPQYTRPAEWNGFEVPKVLTSGDHAAIERWRRAESLRRTRETRPDLFRAAPVSKKDLDLL